MNSTPSPFTREKIALICDHIETLCRQSANLMAAGEAAALAALQARKAIILDELRQSMERFNSVADALFREGVAQRVKAALGEELRAVNEILITIKLQLNQQAAGELRLAKIRRGYGACAKPEEPAYDVSISARG